MPPTPAAGRGKVQVIDVWADNQEAELARIRGLVRDFKIAAVAASLDDVLPIGPSPASSSSSSSPRTLERCYEAVRSSVDRVRSAQVGLVLTNREGELALGGHAWRFHLGDTPDAAEDDAKPPLPARRRRRADPRRVCGALRECSHATMRDGGIWVTSDGAEAVAYLVRHAYGGSLPRSRGEFLRACGASFPALYDLRVLSEWTTVTGDEPPLADAGPGPGPGAFARFLALARDDYRFRDEMVGYTGFLFGLGAVDDWCLVSRKRTMAEYEERVRRMMALFAEVRDEDFLRRIVLG